MPTNVRTDGKDLVTQYARGTVVQPSDPVFLKPKGDPGIALHTNDSTVINNAAGTVFDHKTQVAHKESYLGNGRHVPIVIVGRNVPMVDGDNGFTSWMKNVFIEGRNAVMHAVDTGVNSLWQVLPGPVKAAVENGESIVSGMTIDDFKGAAKEEAQAMLDALMSTDTLIALAQTAALMGLQMIPLVGQLVGGGALVARLQNAVEAASGAAEELKAIVTQWTQPMSPAQQAEARKRLASWMMRGAISTVMVAVGRAGVKVSKAAIGKFNSTRKANVGEAPAPAATTCACATNRPVIIATGEKTLEQSDFALPGPIDLDWSRRYRSGDVRVGWFGQGWSHPFAVELLLGAQEHRYFDAQGRCVKLPVIGVGVEHFDAYEGMTFSRPDADHWTLTRKDGQTQTFVRPRDDIWRLPLAKLSDRVGRVVTMDYGPVPEDPFEPWYPKSLSDSAGRTLLLEWSRTHRLCAVVMLPNRLTNASIDDQPETLARYEYDTNGDLIRFIDANGGTRSYEWRNHVLTGYTLADGARFAAEYDVASPTGRVVRSWNVDKGEGLRFDYLDRARATRITDALNRRTLYEYDQRRDIVAITGPDGVRTETPFDTNGHPRGSVDALGRETFYRFDARGNLTQRVDPSGAKTTVAYDALDLPIRVTDALGHTWQRIYDDRGQLIELVDPLNQTTRYVYDTNGQPVQITDARGGVKMLDWDQAGNLIGHTDCSGRSTRFTYDARGRLITRTDAMGQTTRHAWDGADRLVLSVEPTGAEHRYTWDGEGRLLTYTDPLGATTAYRYDAAGRAIQRQDAAGRTLRYAYDAAGRLAQLVNENGASTRFGYDIADNLVDEIGFDGRHQRYVYNIVAELTHLIETGGSDVGPGKVTRFERDVLGRLTRKSAQGDETCDARFDYDQLGRLTNANNAAAQMAFAYDPVGQLLCERQKLGGEASLLQHAYDPLGNRIATKLPDGRQLHWLFYGSGHLHQINIEKQGQHEVIVDIERDALHRETERTQGQLTSQFDHDPMGRLTRHRASTTRGRESQIERGYVYDLAGNLCERLDPLRGDVRYQYDPTGRILAARGGPSHNELFAFDPAGNLLPTTASVGNIQDNRLLVYEDLRFEYDAHGNVINRKKGAHTEAKLNWNADHQLQNAEVTRHGTTQITTYAYDALGRRTHKRDAFGATEYLWDGDLMIQTRRGNKQAPPRQNSCRLHITKNLGAAKKDESGSIRTGIQGQGGGEIAAARERITGGGRAGGGHCGRDAGAVARGCAVHARTRAGVDRRRPTGSRDHHGGADRGRQERVVSRARRVSGGVDQVARQLHDSTGPPRGRTSQPAGHARRPQTHQGTRARPATQGPGTGRDSRLAGAVKKSRGDLPHGRGRMIGLEDRQALSRDIDTAHAAGARLRPACEVAGIDLRTLQRWKAQAGLTAGDGRPKAVRPMPSHALSLQERAALLDVANEPRFADVPPARIVPMLADEGVYLASESSFSRVLRAHGQNAHRGRAKEPRASRPPTTHIATGPRQVWCWDMTYLPAVVMGRWFHLYLILDLYSRKIVGWEAHDSDDSDHAVHLVRRTALAEGIASLETKPVLHGDNGSTLKATTVLAMLNWLGIKPSYSRPRVSDDNAYAESLFRTAKYRPEFPAKGFTDLDQARAWAADFVRWYNVDHRHSGIRYVSPAQRHDGRDKALLAARHALYCQAKQRHPNRWSGKTRDWSHIDTVTLNPEREAVVDVAANDQRTQREAA